MNKGLRSNRSSKKTLILERTFNVSMTQCGLVLLCGLRPPGEALHRTLVMCPSSPRRTNDGERHLTPVTAGAHIRHLWM